MAVTASGEGGGGQLRGAACPAGGRGGSSPLASTEPACHAAAWTFSGKARITVRRPSAVCYARYASASAEAGE